VVKEKSLDVVGGRIERETTLPEVRSRYAEEHVPEQEREYHQSALL